jgi:hypothetical protein
MVIATSILGVNINAIGSDVTTAPASMVTSVLPLNLNSLLVDRPIAEPPVETAICTDFIVTAPVLNSLENLRRNVSPPIETRTICRNELFVKPGEGGIFPGSTSCGAVLQVPTHCCEAVENPAV